MRPLVHIAMPGEDGFSLIQAIRALPVQQGGKIPAIALSAMASDEDRQRGFEADFDRYLTKPMDIRELVHAMLDLLPEAKEESTL